MTRQLVVAAALGAVAVAASLVLRNRVIRRRMIFTLVVLLVFAAIHVVATYDDAFTDALDFERPLLALAAINIGVALLLNPWFADRVLDRAPAIVQDAIVIALLLLYTTFFYQQDAKLFATSAIAAAVLGFALQETLGNAFAGLAIQTEKPFRVGHWIAVAGYEGRVMEVTWRATKMRTKAGNMVVLPNNVVAREAINNYTEPARPTRLFVEVGATYGVPPNAVNDAILAAIDRAPHALATPPPDILLGDFAASAVTYRARFWIEDFEFEEIAKDEVRRAIYYEFGRRNIEIPYPIQVEYSRQWGEGLDEPARRVEEFARLIAKVPVLAVLPAEGQRALAEAGKSRLFGKGEVIVREGEAGASMFVIGRGQAVVTIAGGREVARIDEGGYFGEMSALTGDPRTATVAASTDCATLEIDADTFKHYVKSHPDAIERLAEVATKRREELSHLRATAAASTVESHVSLAARMRKFFGLH